ncbi:MAG: DUF4446 family protein [Lachnospiraceae bacterium]|nr:DUF4446 family protein [Lachnospiraceae bacterium]
MQSSILSTLGLGNLDPGIWVIVLCVCFIAIIILMAMNSKNKKLIASLSERIDDLTSGEGGKSLEEELGQIIEDNKKLLKDSYKNSEDISKIFGRLKGVYQKMGIVRYDAYQELGGDMSAVVVILDEENNGVLINNVYSPEGGYVYTRVIEKGKCEHELGKEEQEALNKALKK